MCATKGPQARVGEGEGEGGRGGGRERGESQLSLETITHLKHKYRRQ